MYEATSIPPRWIPKVKDVDLLVVPCEHNKRLFRQYTDVPIEVCLEGTLIDKFTFTERTKGKPFRFLWFGASNERKGYKHMIYAWAYFNLKYPEIACNCELYMKTTQNSVGEKIIGFKDGQPIKEVMPKERVFDLTWPNTNTKATVDTRKVSEEELVKIYHDSHCFVFPTMGEGFGLTLAEAMSTGLPCIYTPWSGPVDFCSKKEGYPLKFNMTKVTTMIPQLSGTPIIESESFAANPDIKHIARRMVEIYRDYGNALQKGKNAAERIRKEITWDISAKRFIDIIRSYV